MYRDQIDRPYEESEQSKDLAKVPFKCVVCNGFGTVKHGQLQCHGCKGKGFVIVDQRDDIDGESQQDYS